MGAKAKANTGSSNPSHDAAEAGHGHHHHRFLHGHLQHYHQAKAQPAASRPVDRSEGASDDINDCADAFIKRFRQQLELQRLQSIENYQQMLARGL